VCGDDVTGFEGWGEKVEEEECVVPDQDYEEIDDGAGDFVEDAHFARNDLNMVSYN